MLGSLVFVVGLVAWMPLPAGSSPAQPGPIVLHVQTPHFNLGAAGVQVPGYAWNDVPGAPRLPVYGTVVELPPDASWELSYASAGRRILDRRVAVPAVPVPDLSLIGPRGWMRLAELPAAVPTVDRPDPRIYAANTFYPSSPVVPGAVQWQRGRRLLALRAFPFQHNPVTGELRYHPDLVITVRLSPGAPTAASAARASQPEETTGVGAGALRVYTAGRGMYRLTYDDLDQAGVPVTTVNPASFAMTHRGQVTQIQVTGAEDGHFDPGDLVIFYAEPYQGRYMAQNVYAFLYKTSPAAPGTRMASRTVIPTGAEPVLTTITRTVRIEKDTAYYSDYPLPTDADHWFDDSIYPSTSAQTMVTRTYDLALQDPLPAGQVSFRGLFYGGLDQWTIPDQSLELSLNSHPVTTFQWEGRVPYTATATAPAAWLDRAPNQIVLVGSLAQLPDLSEYWVYPDWVALSYPAQAIAHGDSLYVEGIDVAGISVELAATGFTTETVRVYDVRNPLQPVQLTATQAISNGVSYDLDVWDAWDAGDAAPGYFLTTDAALAAPARVEFDEPSNWHGPHEADYIAIVHRSLWDAVQPLLDRRAAEGLRVAKVDVQDIYDEFSDGLVYPPAIRDFLSNAYHTWNGGEAPPRYVLLVGDGHYDFKGVSGTTLPNLIPPYLIAIDPWIGETAADNRYVSVDGPDDYLPDMAVGRIPARNAADVSAVIDKIVKYEDTGQSPDGTWQNRVDFVADDYANSAGNFHVLSDEVRTNWLPPGYESKRIYYRMDAAHDTGEEMRAAIKQAFNDSAIYLQWFGHASRFRWGSTSMFNIFDPPNLAANTRLPLSVAYSCWAGYFINVDNNWQTLGEQLLLQPGRGSIADLSPSGLHIGSALLTLDEGMILAIFRDRIHPVGEAVNQGKLYYFANSSAWQDVIDTEVLFGDPALKLRVPPTPPTPPAIAISAKDMSAVLSWTHLLDSQRYEVWRDTTPYFDPAAGQGTQVGTVEAGFRGAGTAFDFLDDGTTPPPPVSVIGDPATNYFWVVRSGSGDGVSGNSNRVGEFDFALQRGE